MFSARRDRGPFEAVMSRRRATTGKLTCSASDSMKIIYLAAGAAGMYCGSCLHDNTLAAALLALGEPPISRRADD